MIEDMSGKLILIMVIEKPDIALQRSNPLDNYNCGHQSDYFCRVIEDCVAGSSEEAHEAALRAMEYLQKGARRSLGEVLNAMEEYE